MAAIFRNIMGSCCACLMINEMREEVNKLRTENENLKKENDRLEKSTKKLQEMEQKLKDVSVLQGKSVDELVKQVQEFKEIQESIKESLEAKVIQNLISVVMRSDNDNDFVIDPEEVDALVLRLKNIDGVDFSEENFQKALKKAGYDPAKVDMKKGGYSIQAVIEVIKNLLDDEVPAEDNIFTIQPEKLLKK